LSVLWNIIAAGSRSRIFRKTFFSEWESFAVNQTKELAYLKGIVDIPGLGPSQVRGLLTHYGCPELICSAPIGDLVSLGVPVELVDRIRKLPEYIPVLLREIERYEANNIKLISCFSDDFPARLREIGNPPPILYSIGPYRFNESACVAVVGSRRASDAAVKLAFNIGRNLAERGITVISGLAEGVDTAAHRGAVDADRETVAVLGSGLFRPYPRSNLQLMKAICRKGSCISECRPEDGPAPVRFMARNRLISGLSRAVLVVECNPRSGTMDTARYSRQQQRGLIAIRWPKGSPGYPGWKALNEKGVISADYDSMDSIIESIMNLLSDEFLGNRQKFLF
jgi:DNA processing protein